MKPKKKILPLLVAVSLLTVLAGVVQATTESITVQSGKDTARTINLAKGDHISMAFTVLGPSPSSINFCMVFPNGTITEYGQTSHFSLDFLTNTEGECQLHSDNTNSSDAQLVTLNYNAEHYIFGMPQMIFLLIFIAAVLLCVVAGYVIMGKYS